MDNSSINNLAETAIEVTPHTIAVSATLKEEHPIQVEHLISRFDNCFCLSNGVVAFIYEGKFFVTTATPEKLNVLHQEGFREEYFEVPFSNQAYPKAEKCRWAKLLAYARQRKSCIA